MFKFIVMSDLHLVPRGKVSHSIDTTDRLERAISHINSTHSDAAFCVLNGDLADHGDTKAYQQLRTQAEKLTMPVYFTLGNHDDAAAFRGVFDPEQSDFDHAIEIEGQTVIVLNSQDPGKVTGILSDGQIAWLQARLAEAKGQPVTLILHHPIGDLFTGLDMLRLKNPEPLIALLKDHGAVRQVISGHVHMTTTGVLDGLPVTTLSGNHYSFSPFSHADIADMTRIDGPGELAVVLSDAAKTVVHFDKFLDKNEAMSNDLFIWDGPKTH